MPDPCRHDHGRRPREARAEERRLLAVQRGYDLVRRAVGHLAGVLVLARESSHSFQPEVSARLAGELAAELRRVASELAPERQPESISWRTRNVGEAARHAAEAAEQIAAAASSPDTAWAIPESALNHLQQAYRLINNTNDPRYGLVMVDVNHACGHRPSPNLGLETKLYV
jgi:hypothetical protein